MSTSSNEQRFRTFGDTFGKGAPAFLHVADTGVVFTNADGQSQTGAWRAATPSDLNSTTSAATSSTTTVPSGSATVSNDIVSGNNQVLFASNPNRLAVFIQNLHTGALMVRFSASAPTTGLMNVLLKGDTAVNAGNGGSWIDSPAIYKGPISVSSLGGAPTLYNSWEI